MVIGEGLKKFRPFSRNYRKGFVGSSKVIIFRYGDKEEVKIPNRSLTEIKGKDIYNKLIQYFKKN